LTPARGVPRPARAPRRADEPCGCGTGVGPSLIRRSGRPVWATSLHTTSSTPPPLSPSPAARPQERPADARARLRGHNAGRLLRSVRRRPHGSGRPDGRRRPGGGRGACGRRVGAATSRDCR